jgi:hypothetical protein
MADVGTPEWWLRRLHRQIVERGPKVDEFTDYYEGEHRLAFESKRFREAFGGLFHAFSDNWCGVVVDSVEERLNPQGLRIGDMPEGDKDAWRIWQENDLDAGSQLVHSDALIAGESYVRVWLSDDPVTPEIIPLNACEAVVENDPKRPRLRRAGLRIWRDDWGHDHAELFLPDRYFLFVTAQPRQEGMTDAANLRWVPDVKSAVGGLDADGGVANPLGEVPIVPFVNRPRTHARRGITAQSELADIIPLQDAVNKLVADMLVGSEKAALPARWATGLEVPVDPVTNRPIKPKVDSAELMINTDAAGSFGVFQAADLRNFVQAVELVIQHIASISKTPPHYLNASADRLSGESIKAAETGLVAKVRRRQTYFGNSWEQAMRLAGRLAGIDHLAAAKQSEVLWADPESRTEAEHTDAVLKLQALGLPNEMLWEMAGLSPQQIARAKTMVAEQDLFGPDQPMQDHQAPVVTGAQ